MAEKKGKSYRKIVDGVRVCYRGHPLIPGNILYTAPRKIGSGRYEACKICYNENQNERARERRIAAGLRDKPTSLSGDNMVGGCSTLAAPEEKPWP